jgi:hypothetical protein
VSDRLLPVLIRDHLGAHGVRTRADVVAALVTVVDPHGDRGLAAMLDDVVDEVVRAEPTLTVVGEEVVDLAALAGGSGPFAHRITAEEIQADEVHLEPDLALIGVLAADLGGLHRAEDGWPLSLHTIRTPAGGRAGGLQVRRVLRGPAGWLRRFNPGALLRCSADAGVLVLETAPEPAGDTAADDAGAGNPRPTVQAALDEAVMVLQQGDQVPVDAVDLQAAGLLHGWIRGWVPDGDGIDLTDIPFGDVLAACGYETDGTAVARPDIWEPYAELSRTIRLVWAHQDHGTGDLDGLRTVLDAFAGWRADPAAIPASSVFALIHRSDSGAFCVEEELLRAGGGRPGELRAFLDAAEPPRGRAAAALWALRAVAAEAEGDLGAARDHTDAALAADPMWLPSVEARFRECGARGRLTEAVRLLQVARTDADTELQSLRALQRTLEPNTGRNEPCPCGSGRKFKQCHLGRLELSSIDRGWWLVRRALDHQELVGSPDLDLVVGGGERSPLDEAPHLVTEAALFDRGGFARFVEHCDALFDEADRALADAWVAGQRPSVYRVEARAGAQLTVVDLARPDDPPLAVERRLPGQQPLEVGDDVWMRLLPCGDRWWSGIVTRLLSTAERDALLALDPDHGEHATRRFRVVASLDEPPELTDRGRPVVFCMRVWALGAGEEAVRSFAAELAEPERAGNTGDTDDTGSGAWRLSAPDLDDGYLFLIPPSPTTEPDDPSDHDDDDVTENHDDTGWGLLVSCRSLADHAALEEAVRARFPAARVLSETTVPRRRRLAIDEEEAILVDAYEDPDDDEWLDDDDLDLDLELGDDV